MVPTYTNKETAPHLINTSSYSGRTGHLLPPSHWRTASPPPLPQSHVPACHYVLCPHRSPTTLGVYIWGEGGLGQQGVGFQQDCDVMSFSQISWPWPGDLFLSGPSPVVTRPVARPDPSPSIYSYHSPGLSVSLVGRLGI